MLGLLIKGFSEKRTHPLPYSLEGVETLSWNLEMHEVTGTGWFRTHIIVKLGYCAVY